MRLAYTAGEGDAGRRVYHILRRELRVSAEGVKRLKAAQAVAVEGVPVHMDRRLAPGETVTADLALAERPPEFPPERGELEVLFESDGYLAVNKPVGMLTHPSPGRYTGTLLNLASGYLLDRTGSPWVHAVNRLDRDTSGVVLFAKSAHAKTLAAGALAGEGAEKLYLALLRGRLPEERGVVDLPIAREGERSQKRVVSGEGKRAVTEYETLAVTQILGETVTAAHFSLHTGRTHQIRVHCAHLGCPILGDELYGGGAGRALAEALGLHAQLLHAWRLTFTDPFTGGALVLTAPVRREDMRKTLKFFENTT